MFIILYHRIAHSDLFFYILTSNLIRYSCCFTKKYSFHHVANKTIDIKWTKN